LPSSSTATPTVTPDVFGEAHPTNKRATTAAMAKNNLLTFIAFSFFTK